LRLHRTLYLFSIKKDENAQGIRCHECSRFGYVRVDCSN
jgi:hypothetical protein